MKQISLGIEGMACGGCVAKLRNALASLPGVTVEDVRVGSALLLVDSAVSGRAAVEGAIMSAGFRVVEAPPLPPTCCGGH